MDMHLCKGEEYVMTCKHLWGSALAIGVLVSTEAWAQSTPTFTIAHEFTGEIAFPIAGVISDASGALYGTTSGGPPGSQESAIVADERYADHTNDARGS